MARLPNKLGFDFWGSLISAAIMLSVSLFMFFLEDGTKTAVGLILGVTFLASAVFRFRRLRFAQRLKRYPELAKIYDKRAL
tara:strand:- start:456 stop:698 length:243 start_codon:yes stop_codon:yes gene_type:complete